MLSSESYLADFFVRDVSGDASFEKSWMNLLINFDSFMTYHVSKELHFCFISSCISFDADQYGAREIGDVPDTNSIANSISRFGDKPVKSSGNTSGMIIYL
ncbi:hypothetical protein Tco_0952095 [Tanacetum coccineum]|uniref:Uncharacterized protein n=1 Tax=Tanacetum coccineum TaxID=301880 RepID=A0ABQ5DW40_9ASTR